MCTNSGSESTVGYWGSCGLCLNTLDDGFAEEDRGVGWCFPFTETTPAYDYFGTIEMVSDKEA